MGIDRNPKWTGVSVYFEKKEVVTRIFNFRKLVFYTSLNVMLEYI